MVRRFIKKPLEIEAFKVGDDPAQWYKDEINKPVHEKKMRSVAYGQIEIKTLEGVMTANFGDYIIKGIKGEFYPCKPDIFEATYEEINSPYIIKMSNPIDASVWNNKGAKIIPIIKDESFTKNELTMIAWRIEEHIEFLDSMLTDDYEEISDDIKKEIKEFENLLDKIQVMLINC